MNQLETRVTTRAKSTGRVVDYKALKDQGELIDASRIRSFLMTTTIPDVIVETWELCQEFDSTAKLSTLVPNSAISASLVLQMISPHFRIECFRYLKRGWFPLNPFAAEFGKNYDVEFRLESTEEDLHQRFIEFWQSGWETGNIESCRDMGPPQPTPPPLPNEFDSIDVDELIGRWRENPEMKDPRSLSSVQFRRKIYQSLHPRPHPDDRSLLLRCFEWEIGYRKQFPSGDYFENLYWCAFLLYRIGRVEDCLPMWRAKTTVSQDVQVGLDIQFLVGAGVDETLAFLEESNDSTADELAEYIEGCRECEDFDNMDSWLEGQVMYYE